jgi:hypothetical protein
VDTRNVGLETLAKYRSIANWGLGGAIMFGLPASFILGDDDSVGGFMTMGFLSFMAIRAFLMMREYQDAKDGF